MNKSNKKTWVRLLRRAFIGFAIFLFILEFNFLYITGYMPGVSDIIDPKIASTSFLFSSDGQLIGKYYIENRVPVAYNKMPIKMVDALIATEDVRFYNHYGIDIKSIFSSMWSTAKGDKRGASTLTQQLAKNLYQTRKTKSQGLIRFIPGVRTVIYKLKEWITALKLEIFYSKEEIIEMYLNTVGFGNNAFGVKVAARTYFNKDQEDLTTEECALLVGMLKATSTYNPIRHPEKALERRNVVLSQMLKYGKITEKEHKEYANKTISLDLSAKERPYELDSYTRQAVRNYLKEWCEENDYDIYRDGLRIYSTIDIRLQKHAEDAVQDHMRQLQRRFYSHWSNENPWRDEKGNEISGFIDRLSKRSDVYRVLKEKYGEDTQSISRELNRKKKMKVFTWKGDEDTTFSSLDSIQYYSKILQCGMMTLDPFEGHVKVWVGGINFEHFKYDHVKQSLRQPGSTFKPFAYLAAIDNGWAPCDKLRDEPLTIKYVEKGEPKEWSPKNADRRFSYNEMSLRWAMGKSCNAVTAQLTNKIGWNKVVKYAKKLGITSELESVPSICLGSSDVSLYDMVRSYGAFLNTGYHIEPILVTHIKDRKGKVIENFKAKKTRVISEETAYLMIYMFRGGIQEPGGTSRALWAYDLFKKGNEIGGKTGTTSNYSDGWYMGISKDLVTGVWVGADERCVHFRTGDLGEGSRMALPIYGKFMERVYKDPNSGITLGKFKRPDFKITKEYDCPTPEIFAKEDSASIADSLSADPLLEFSDNPDIIDDIPLPESEIQIP